MESTVKGIGLHDSLGGGGGCVENSAFKVVVEA